VEHSTPGGARFVVNAAMSCGNNSSATKEPGDQVIRKHNHDGQERQEMNRPRPMKDKETKEVKDEQN
jgi:hypothetical protein